MLQSYFLDLHRSNKTPYHLAQHTQIEPQHPEDPDELYRMKLHQHDGKTVFFDVVFYPDRAEIRSERENILIGSISKESVESPVDVAKEIERMKPSIMKAS